MAQTNPNDLRTYIGTTVNAEGIEWEVEAVNVEDDLVYLHPNADDIDAEYMDHAALAMDSRATRHGLTVWTGDDFLALVAA